MASPGLATAAGAGQGLQEVLQNMLAQEASRQAQEKIDQTGAENASMMKWRNDQMGLAHQDRQDRLNSEAGSRAEATQARTDALAGAKQDKATTLGQARIKMMPIGANVDPQTMDADIQGGLANRGNYGPSSADTFMSGAGKSTPTGEQPTAPVPIKWRGTQDQIEKSQAEQDKANAPKNDPVANHQADRLFDIKHPLPKEPSTRTPPFQEVDTASNMNSAEIQAVKVLKHLKQTGLDQSNDPADPRFNTFVAQTLKMAPQDQGKTDALQRTAYIKAVLARSIMGGRPSNAVLEMIQQHLPDTKMSGKQLSNVIRDVMDEVGTKRTNMQNFYGPDQAKQFEPTGGQTYKQYLDEESKGAQSQSDVAPDAYTQYLARTKK
jgi:hypothetical protein